MPHCLARAISPWLLRPPESFPEPHVLGELTMRQLSLTIGHAIAATDEGGVFDVNVRNSGGSFEPMVCRQCATDAVSQAPDRHQRVVHGPRSTAGRKSRHRAKTYVHHGGAVGINSNVLEESLAVHEARSVHA